MQQIHFEELGESVASDEDTISWNCTVCGRARLCPYAAPCLSDVRESCRSCGDLLAQIAAAPMALRNDVNLEVM